MPALPRMSLQSPSKTERQSDAALGAGSRLQQSPSSSNGTTHSSNGAASASSVQYSPVSSSLQDPQLLSLMQQVATGAVPPEAAAMGLRELSAGMQQVKDFAQALRLTGTAASCLSHKNWGKLWRVEDRQVDSWRSARTGAPEVVWGPGKTPEQIAAIMARLAESEAVVLATRITPEVHRAVLELLPGVTYNSLARTMSLRTPGNRKQERLPGTVAVVSAGTADEGVAEECRAVADFMGCYCFRLPDVSVDGLHRILHNLPAVRAADVVVVVSGTDGALPSVVAGLVESPVIAVPTSVGYGAALGGLTPLLSSLVASSPGVAVVNIDNGFGAAMAAARVLKTAAKLRKVAASA